VAEALRLLLVGAGALGSRHLQSLVRMDALEGPAVGRIDLVEPSADAVATALARAAEAAGGRTLPAIATHRDLHGVEGRYDLAIVATGAAPRRAILEALLPKVELRLLVLEKFLYPNEADYAAADTLLAGTPTIVHTPRSAWPGYAALARRHGLAERPFVLEATGSDFNLLSNAVHFLDLFRALGGLDAARIAIEAFAPDGPARPAKRPGTVETTGALTARSARGDALIVRSFEVAPGATPLPLRLRLTSAAGRSEIDEGARIIAHDGLDGTAREPFALLQCSEMAPVWRAGLRGEATALPDHAAASRLHLLWMAAIRPLFPGGGPLPIT
jgi:hypothetical protein